ncbi:MFS transporter [Streptomyces coffeae]|uniref:MHS family MFS transporter n=1 Tax=Streptomyces coffeae TaxID=621382 RepID=A0ABS1NKD5_9ACTN|nr:MFS transporter [Streptomyces coffeae]MBL1100566.1 MHS family MFS transporter [Streptomyces coffeae]
MSPSSLPLNSSEDETTADPEAEIRKLRRVAYASLVGTAIEWYDFFIYGLAVVLVFAPQFFPSSAPSAGALAAFATFAVGFAARPLGGIVVGHLGDRVGRKKMLVASLLMMGVSTTLIGMLPTYATAGALAPILLILLRLVQGVAVGGEWGGAVLISVEHSPEGKRGFYGSFTQVGLSVGLITSNLVFLTLSLTTTREQFAAWGWRIPFLFSGVLVLVGLYIRSQVEESPEFAARRNTARTLRLPIVAVLRTYWRQVLLITAMFSGLTAMGYIAAVYSVSYGTTRLGLSSTFMLVVVLAAAVIELPAVLYFSAASDRRGRSHVIIWGSAASVLVGLFFVPVLATGATVLVALAVVLGRLVLTPLSGPSAAMAAESFPVEMRYSGASIGYQLGSIAGGALAPLVATLLVASPAGTWGVSIYLVVLMAVSGLGAYGLGRIGARSASTSGTVASAPAP